MDEPLQLVARLDNTPLTRSLISSHTAWNRIKTSMAELPGAENYLLSRGFTAATRLNCQHYIWKQDLRYNLHPDIPLLQDGARIADVASGTGAWLLEFARDHPNVQCDGFDISLAQCPPKEWLPLNVDFWAWNMFGEAPEDLIGKYDVVHIRLVVCVVDKDPVPLIKNLAKLLKPHGYLQWDEIDVSDTIITAVDDSIKRDAITKMAGIMKGQGSPKWILKLPEFLNEHGFQAVQSYRSKPDMSMLKFHTDMHILAWLEIVSRLPEGDERKKGFSQLLVDVSEESKQGAGYACANQVIVARKLA